MNLETKLFQAKRDAQKEKLLTIKKKYAEMSGKFGIGIFNSGVSYNKYSTKSYDELKKIREEENILR